MKQSTGIGSLFSTFIFIGLVFGLQACGGGGGASNAAPVFTSGASISVAENTTVTGYTATATDAENNTVTFSLTGGADQTKFSIDSASGVLSFQTTKDFESPTDTDTNNTYVVDITATDGTSNVIKTITITVTNVVEITGYYDTGTHTELGYSDLKALVNGNRLMIMTNSDSSARGSNLFFDGLMNITGNNYTATLTAYTNSLNPISISVTGSFVDESSITGVISGNASVNGTFNLSFASINNQTSDLVNVDKTWIGSFTIIDQLIISATGEMSNLKDIPLNSTFLANCSVSTGTSVQPISSTNMFKVNFTLAGCTNNTDANGTYTGLATSYSETNPFDHLVLFVSNGNGLVAIPDDMVP